jgi:hypothetical protein
MTPNLEHNQVETLRSDMIRATPEDKLAAENANDLPASSLYIPASHLKALSPDKPLVVGMRGAGKSYWWLQLQKPDLLPLIYGTQINSPTQVECKPGFGKRPSPSEYPDRKILNRLIQQHSAEDIWRAVIGRHIPLIDQLIPSEIKDDWDSRVSWTTEHVEQVQRAMYEFDKQLQQEKKQLIILFDSLDDAADTWDDKKNLLRGLFRVLVDLRTYRAIRGKVFIRPDMLTPDIYNFPDASKLISERVDLSWSRADLYALLWQALGNTSDLFRDWCKREYGQSWSQTGTIWQPPAELRKVESLQRKVFHGLAGEWMGKDARRGFPYTYFPNHLGDAKAQVSPRSFLASIRKAAEVTQDKYATTPYPLHYEAIKTGLQYASTIRMAELQVEYPWVAAAMELLRDKINLPCNWDEIRQIWDKGNLIQKLQKAQLKPERLDEGLEGIREEMGTIAIFEDAKDGVRINVPDVFRIGYGLGRKGGIKPVR